MTVLHSGTHSIRHVSRTDFLRKASPLHFQANCRSNNSLLYNPRHIYVWCSERLAHWEPQFQYCFPLFAQRALWKCKKISAAGHNYSHVCLKVRQVNLFFVTRYMSTISLYSPSLFQYLSFYLFTDGFIDTHSCIHRIFRRGVPSNFPCVSNESFWI